MTEKEGEINSLEIIDIRKPTKYGSSLYILMTGILDESKFYKIMSNGNRIIIEEALAR